MIFSTVSPIFFVNFTKFLITLGKKKFIPTVANGKTTGRHKATAE